MSSLPAVVSGSTFEHNLLVVVKHQCKWSSLPIWCSRHIVADGRSSMRLIKLMPSARVAVPNAMTDQDKVCFETEESL